LKIKDTDMTFVNFDRHISQSAKERALNAANKAKHRRSDDVPNMSRSNRDKKGTREEKNNKAVAYGNAPVMTL
jgi:hypothetical protein